MCSTCRRVFRCGAEGQWLQRIEEARQRPLLPHCSPEHIRWVNSWWSSTMNTWLSVRHGKLHIYCIYSRFEKGNDAGSYRSHVMLYYHACADLFCGWKSVMLFRIKQWLLFIDFIWRTEETLWGWAEGGDVLCERRIVGSVSLRGHDQTAHGSIIFPFFFFPNPLFLSFLICSFAVGKFLLLIPINPLKRSCCLSNNWWWYK